jgi:hypothetical protein
MSDDSAKGRLDISEVGDITRQLNDGHLSRHGLREHLTALGVGFGAAFMLGLTGAQASPAAETPDTTVALKSTHPAVIAIIQNGAQSDQTPTVSAPLQQLSWYNRYFRRFYTRYYHRW